MNSYLVILILAESATISFGFRVVCYHTNWSRYQKDPFNIQNIDPTKCTHIVYSFLGLNPEGYIESFDHWNDFGDEWTEGGITKFMRLKERNPSVKLLLGVGGWSEGPADFQKMVRDPKKRRIFLNSSSGLMKQVKFDGLEIHWIFHDSIGGTPEDKAGYSLLVKELKSLYKEYGWILSISTAANAVVMDNSYDIPVLSNYTDFINVRSYDLHGSWDGRTGHVAPLRPLKTENEIERNNNVEAIMKRYIQKGANPNKLNVATVGYGRTFTLVNPNINGINSPTKGAGSIEPLPYNTFCVLDRQGIWEKFRNEEQVIPYAVAKDLWVGYEDVISLKEKVKFVKSAKLGGVAFWSLDTDDFKGVCGVKNPLLTALNEELENTSAN